MSAVTGPAIEVVDLAKRYGRTEALAGLTMNVEQGEVFGFLGPNGAGKTTAIKLLLGLARPSGGHANVLGAPAGDVATRARIGYLPELFRYQGFLRAREVLELHCRLAHVPGPARRAEIGASLELVDLADRADDLVGGFSKGMQQRLGLAVALLGRPDLVLLDEPTSALDPLGRADVRRIVREVADRGTTVFLDSHLLTEVERVCDRVAIIDRGRVVAGGRLSDLLGADGVRIRATGLSSDAMAALSSFGPPVLDGEWLTIRPLAHERVPDVVAAIVAAGGRVHAVDPGGQTLENLFVGLVGDARR
jgi:ABC-2 type transport system ATP-binding protein